MPSLEERINQVLATAMREFQFNWWTRNDLARSLGKKQLNPQDEILLTLMAKEGRLEARESETRAPSGRRWEYRIKQEKNKA